VDERKELLNILRAMWQKGDSPLHRIYSSWEQLEANVDVKTRRKMGKEKYVIRRCPNCGAEQRVTKPLEDFFPYQNCRSCRHAFYVSKDLTVRKLMAEEKEDMPAAWVRIVEDLYKKKLAIVFRLE
jgi:predicted RNA-binding Zn-ribbon protein involved in translation (DUF1610 family)